MSELQRFLAARDHLLATRTDYAAAVAGFAWPQLDRFNWALDYFDTIARDNPAPALHIVEESGSESKLSYAQLSARSSQVANFLARLGAKRGDRILLMLGNEVPLWESMLAAIKLGAVLIPATTLLSGDDLADRLQRGKVRHVITNEAGATRVDELPAAVLAGINRICVSATARPGWTAFADSASEPSTFSPAGASSVTDPLLEYFTSGTTARPKLV
ncbi:MAG TPA: AMP-binding protein, partial [Quisquiliibacterium sp.]|nr:AMP-binding protein [Quisquiliibacterium sp.]